MKYLFLTALLALPITTLASGSKSPKKTRVTSTDSSSVAVPKEKVLAPGVNYNPFEIEFITIDHGRWGRDSKGYSAYIQSYFFEVNANGKILESYPTTYVAGNAQEQDLKEILNRATELQKKVTLRLSESPRSLNFLEISDEAMDSYESKNPIVTKKGNMLRYSLKPSDGSYYYESRGFMGITYMADDVREAMGAGVKDHAVTVGYRDASSSVLDAILIDVPLTSFDANGEYSFQSEGGSFYYRACEELRAGLLKVESPLVVIVANCLKTGKYKSSGPNGSEWVFKLSMTLKKGEGFKEAQQPAPAPVPNP